MAVDLLFASSSYSLISVWRKICVEERTGLYIGRCSFHRSNEKLEMVHRSKIR